MRRRVAVDESREPDRFWSDVQAAADELSFRAALACEVHGWPTDLLRAAFWLRSDVPKAHRGLEAPGRPDPRVMLGGDLEQIRAFRVAEDAWQIAASRWATARRAWLERRAAAEAEA